MISTAGTLQVIVMHSLFVCLFVCLFDGMEWNLCSVSLRAVNCATSIRAIIKDVTNL